MRIVDHFVWIALCTLVTFLLATHEPARAEPIAIVEKATAGEIEFETEILPIFQKKCLACHNATEAQGDLVLESPQTVRKGGGEGPAVVPGKSSESLLLKLASRQKEPHMPPPDNEVKAAPLTPDELGLIKRWIDQGAKGELRTASKKIAWQPLPTGMRPIYAAAMTADGQYAAASRGNQVFLYHLPTKREIGLLTDPSLIAGGIYKSPGVADLDLIQSLKFNPAGTLLATGGFRTVKLWAKPTAKPTQKFAIADGQATSLTLSQDGKWVAFGQQSGITQIFDVATGQAFKPLEGHSGPVTAVASLPGERSLVTGSSDKSLRIWNLADQRQLAMLETPSPIHALTIPAGGKQTMTAHEDSRIRVWDLATEPGSPLLTATKELTGHTSAVTALATTASRADLMVSGDKDGTIHVWDVTAGKSIRQMKHGAALEAVAISPDGTRMASAGGAFAKLWKLENGEQVAELKGDIAAGLRVAALTRDASLAKKHVELAKKDLEEANNRKKAEEENQKKASEALTKAESDFKPKEEAAKKVAEEKSGAERELATTKAAKEKAEAAKKAAEEVAAKATEAVASSKSAQELASKLEGETAAPLKGATEKTAATVTALQALLAPWKQDVEKAAQEAIGPFTEAEKKLKDASEKHQKAVDEQTAAQRVVDSTRRGVERALSAVKKATDAIPGFEKMVQEVSVASQQQDEKLQQAEKALKSDERQFRSVAFTPDGRTLCTMAAGGHFQTWDGESGVPMESLETGDGSSLLAISTTGNAVTGGKSGGAIWTSETEWKLLRTIGAPDDSGQLLDRVTALDFTPDGKILAAGGGEPSRSGEIKLFDALQGTLLRTMKDPHSDTVNCLSFSPDGQQLASGGADRFAKCWQVEDGKLARSLEGHTHHVLGVAWRADGRALVTSGADAVLKVWDTRTGEQLRTVQNQFSKEVSGISFLADSELVVASGGDAKVRVINTSNGNQQRDLSGASDYMYCVAASADGKTIVAGGLDGVLRVWNDEGKEIAKFAPPTNPNARTAAK